MKECLNCGKQLVVSETTNNYLKSNFRLKKYCDENCRLEFNNRIKKKNYVLKDTEHDNRVRELNKLIKGEFVIVQGRKNSYNPDIIRGETDYELEIFRNFSKLKHKSKNWDAKGKRVLVVSISDWTRDLFDEVYFLSKGDLIKEK